jgi:methylated-DNA-[protein]-cysteine S-methyltransferase
MPGMLISTPLGRLLAQETDGKLSRLDFTPEGAPELPYDHTPLLLALAGQLQAYFAGNLKHFDIPLLLSGTPFRRAVWNSLLSIPYGQTVSYCQIAAKIGRPRAARAVGQAVHHNPFAILVPCHRVLGKKGALTGYAGGLDRKQALLKLEAGD